ncbi:hypothetical protein ACQCSX_20760 [Pseudarthrobacter sp. P1]|uniref:hypothetical protein n=1 Tax=Pseudarthrobacter sp. P1 TaxID=3418418 RepID=UPI003CF3BA4F
MSTKTSTKPAAKPPAKASAKQAAAARRAGRSFARSLYGTIAVLTLLAGALTVGNLVQLPHPTSVSTLEHAPGTRFAIYTLERKTGLDGAGRKEPDTILGANLSGGADGTVLVSAPRIQEFAALPTALAVATLNDDNTSSLEIVPLDGGAPRLVPLPQTGSVENLHAAASGNLIGYTFTSSLATDQYWNALFVYDAGDPAATPREVQGINGPVAAADWSFAPGSTSLVARTDDQSMFLLDPTSPGKVTPLGSHGGFLGFVPGTGDLVVSDRGLHLGVDPVRYSTIHLATGAATPLSLAPGAGPETTQDGTTTAAVGQPLLLDGGGRYAQVASTFDAGKESSVVNLVDGNGPRPLYRPDPGWSRILNVCLSPTGDDLAIETSAPQYVGDQYPKRAAPTSMETDIVDAKTGALVRTLPGFLPSWCG